MNYQEEKIDKAQKAIKKVRELSEIFCPTDGWMSEDRAGDANKAWQDMMSCLDRIGVAIAKEYVEMSPVLSQCNLVMDGAIIKRKCLRCGYEFYPRSEKLPKTCPNRKCKSPYWNKPRTKGVVPSACPK